MTATEDLEMFTHSYWLSCSVVRAYFRGDSEFFRRQGFWTLSPREAASVAISNLQAMRHCPHATIRERAAQASAAVSLLAFSTLAAPAGMLEPVCEAPAIA